MGCLNTYDSLKSPFSKILTIISAQLIGRNRNLFDYPKWIRKLRRLGLSRTQGGLHN